ncbi:hypothetical protein QTJ16_000090 [Diplocarpon rosae]|uniref:Uncharacterized protein n=1 Tax=Diplocarpon rosae TaxID=946125 RepID=A0AAD9T6P0_9HELO|nr:hypothetical protein QTJ16_000090 [Diplocarpon rosae]PBP17234.1 hypothetical protein BUE80_DR012099 [Diplocarpon rosae]
MARRTGKKNSADVGPKESIVVTIDLDSDQSDCSSASVTAPASKRQKNPSKVIQVPKPKKKRKKNKSKKPSALNVSKEKEVLLALQKIAALLSSLGSKAEVEGIIARNNELLQGYRETLTTLLAPASSTHGSQGDVPSTIHLYDKYFAHQGPSKQLYILRPVDVIQGNVRLKRSKVTGFIQHKGSNFPLKYALPGWVACHEYHPKVLDSGFWTEEVQRWGEFHNHNFQGNPYEQYNQKPRGHANASHVEIRLMLWYACERLKELQGVEKPIRALLGELWRLRNYDRTAAEIFLTRSPCQPCLEIIKLIEEYTGITFHICHMPNLGELQPVKRNGWVTFDRYAPNSEDEDEEPFQVVEEEIIQKNKRTATMEVIIQSKPTPLLSNSLQHTHKGKSSNFTETFTETRKSVVVPSSSQIQSDLSDSEVSDYQPRRSKSKRLKPVKANKIPSMRQYGLPMPDDSPFSAQARKQAELLRGEKLKKKRARESEVLSMCSKKSRHTHTKLH